MLATLVIAVFASGFIGDAAVDPATLDAVREEGRAWAGLLLAVLMLLGARSGARGGPLALEAADVHHLLLGPVDRGVALRRPVVGILGYGLAGAAIVGGLLGALAAQRLPGTNSEWVACGALTGALAAGAMLGTALLTASRVVPPLVPVLATAALTLAASLHVAGVLPASGTSAVADVAFWTLGFTPWPLIGLAAVAALVVAGVRWIGGLSIEAAQRRTHLVGQLRFAVTQQDLRSVLLLRRQLAAEIPRSRPWIRRLPAALGRNVPVLTRDLHSILRWPTVRVARILVLGVVAGLALRGVWSGTTPLIVLAGAALYLAALDALEPLAQEVDHPTLVAGYPVASGLLLVHHLAAPTLVMLGAGVAGLAAAWAVDPSVQALSTGAITVITGAAAAVAGGAISIVSEVVLDQSSAAMLPAEVAGPRVVIRTLWPPLVATLGTAPVLAAQRAARAGAEATNAALLVAGFVLVLVVIVGTWVRYREDLHRSMGAAMRGEST